MAYMNQEKKKMIAPQVKNILKKYNAKGTLSVNNYSTLVLTISKSPFPLSDTPNSYPSGYEKVNTYWIEDHYKNEPEKCAMLQELEAALNGFGSEIANHDNSDIMTDYFDVGWYTDIQFGSWKKPYEVIS